MKLGFLLGVAAISTLFAAVPASAGVEFGEPDFPNYMYMARVGLVTCDWQYASYYRACPEPQMPPKPAAAADKKKSKITSKTK
jgi:hypothetical protein